MRNIVLTITATMAAVSFATSLFLNSILGAFGLVTTSVEALNNLKSSQHIVEQMKTRQQVKKQKLTQKLAQRSTRRVASASLAAATIGTVAVAVTMAGFEIHDYCEDLESLHHDSNVLYGRQDKFNFQQCLEEGQEESKRILSEVKESASDSVIQALDSTLEYSAEKWLEIKASAEHALASSSAATSELWSSSKKWLLD